jgi:HTH-type transcriptional regulator/antitoxin HigA
MNGEMMLQSRSQKATTLSPLIFDVVTDLIEMWQTHHVELSKAEPHEVLRYLLGAHDLEQKDLEDIVSQTLVSDFLAGRRAISKNVARALAVRFKADMSVFL